MFTNKYFALPFFFAVGSIAACLCQDPCLNEFNSQATSDVQPPASEFVIPSGMDSRETLQAE
ncbi:MAG: hypothetical protein AAF456_19645 [Planctomycetota bacterium]